MKSRIQLAAARSVSGSLWSTGGGRRVPAYPERRHRPDVVGRRRQHRPDPVQVFGADPGVPGDIGERRVWPAQRGAMAIAPRGQKVIGVVQRLALVEIDDAVHRVLVAVFVRHDRVRREREAARHKHDVAGHEPGGVEVFLDQGGRHRQRLSRVVEARLVGGIHRKLLRRADVDPGQIADGVVVFGVAQPPREHDARIAGMACGLLGGHRLNPLDDRLNLSGRRTLPRLSGRHLPRLEPREHQIPPALIPDDGITIGIGRQIQSGRRLVAAVACEAIGLEKRFDARLKSVGACQRARCGLVFPGSKRPARRAGRARPTACKGKR